MVRKRFSETVSFLSCFRDEKNLTGEKVFQKIFFLKVAWNLFHRGGGGGVVYYTELHHTQKKAKV